MSGQRLKIMSRYVISVTATSKSSSPIHSARQSCCRLKPWQRTTRTLQRSAVAIDRWQSGSQLPDYIETFISLPPGCNLLRVFIVYYFSKEDKDADDEFIIGHLPRMHILGNFERGGFMRRVSVSLLFWVLFLAFVSGSSYADMQGSKVEIEKDRHEECSSMVGGMKHQHAGMMRHGHRIWRSLMGLGLDENQKEAFREIRSRVMKDIIRKMADLRISRIELRDILGKDPVDITSAETKLKQMETMKTDMRLTHLKAMEEIKAKLTPEQREKFKKSLKRYGRWHGRWICDGKGMASRGDKRDEMKPEMGHRPH